MICRFSTAQPYVQCSTTEDIVNKRDFQVDFWRVKIAATLRQGNGDRQTFLKGKKWWHQHLSLTFFDLPSFFPVLFFNFLSIDVFCTWHSLPFPFPGILGLLVSWPSSLLLLFLPFLTSVMSFSCPLVLFPQSPLAFFSSYSLF